MSKSSFPDAARGAESWAEVRARDHVVRYRRSGIGRAVLLLGSFDPDEALWPELIDALGERFRLVVPEPPSLGTEVADWLANFMEGLGMSDVRIVAAGGFCIPALELVLREVGQITRVALVPNDQGLGRRSGDGGVLGAAFQQAGVPLLVVRRSQPAGEVVPLVTGFLGGSGSDAAA